MTTEAALRPQTKGCGGPQSWETQGRASPGAFGGSAALLRRHLALLASPVREDKFQGLHAPGLGRRRAAAPGD